MKKIVFPIGCFLIVFSVYLCIKGEIRYQADKREADYLRNRIIESDFCGADKILYDRSLVLFRNCEIDFVDLPLKSVEIKNIRKTVVGSLCLDEQVQQGQFYKKKNSINFGWKYSQPDKSILYPSQPLKNELESKFSCFKTKLSNRNLYVSEKFLLIVFPMIKHSKAISNSDNNFTRTNDGDLIFHDQDTRENAPGNYKIRVTTNLNQYLTFFGQINKINNVIEVVPLPKFEKVQSAVFDEKNITVQDVIKKFYNYEVRIYKTRLYCLLIFTIGCVSIFCIDRNHRRRRHTPIVVPGNAVLLTQ